jgi:two-component system, OmpR family, KDP operon response regulator KdpE
MSRQTYLVQVVEDDRDVQTVLRLMLEAEGFRVLLAESCSAGDSSARAQRPDVSIVDLGLPDLDGIELIKSIRTWSPMPIIVLSARAAEAQRLAAFEVGADDYVIKPFSGSELVARVRAALRRQDRVGQPAGMLRIGDLAVDPSRRVLLQPSGGEVRLTPLEQRLLEALARYPDRLITHSQLMREVWGASRADTRSLRVLLTNLRKKLELDPTRRTRIEKEAGVGYRLVVEPQAANAARAGL